MHRRLRGARPYPRSRTTGLRKSRVLPRRNTPSNILPGGPTRDRPSDDTWITHGITHGITHRIKRGGLHVGLCRGSPIARPAPARDCGRIGLAGQARDPTRDPRGTNRPSRGLCHAGWLALCNAVRFAQSLAAAASDDARERVSAGTGHRRPCNLHAIVPRCDSARLLSKARRMDGRIDVTTLLFLVLAVVVFLKLRSVLGRRTGHEQTRYERYKAQREASQRNGKLAGQDKVVTLPRRDRGPAQQGRCGHNPGPAVVAQSVIPCRVPRVIPHV